MRSPAFASAVLGPCAGVQILAKCPQFPNGSKLTSHISSNSEADSSALAVRDTLESRCESLLWRITENLLKPVSPSARTAVWQRVWAWACLCWGKSCRIPGPRTQFIATEGAEPRCVFQLRTATSSYWIAATFWISTHHENPPLIKYSWGSKKFKMHFQPGLLHTTRSILGIKSFLLVDAVWGSGDRTSKTDRQHMR